jgi:hypothetical protein
MKWKLLPIVLLIAASAAAQEKKPPAKSTAACVAGPGEQCPPAGDYAKVQALRKKYSPPPITQDDADLFNGIMMRLRSTAPPGMHLDEQKLVYVKNPPVPAQPAPTTPAEPPKQ